MGKVKEAWNFVKKGRKRMVLPMLMTLLGMVGCSLSGQGGGPGGDESLTGRIVLAGSSSMEETAKALAEGFMEKYPDVTVTVEFTGSSAGIEAVAAGSADIGNSSRYLKEEEREMGAAEYIIGFDGIAVCVDGENRVEELTREQLAGIFAGEFRNWSQLGGSDTPIVVVGREAGSGTRNAFEKLLDMEGRCTYANELDSTGAVLARIAVTPGAIGYVSFEAVERSGRFAEQGSVKALVLDGKAPETVNLESGEYPLCRPFLMVVRNGSLDRNLLLRTWFDYVYSQEGQRAVRSVGIVPWKPEEYGK